MSAPTSAATCSRSCRPSTSATPRWATAWARPARRPSTRQSAKRAISIMGDGGFWHNGLTSGIANAVFNKSDNLTLIVDNNYTVGHRRAGHPVVARRQPHAQHLAPDREGGARRRRRMGAHDPPHLRRGRHARGHLREALTTKQPGPKVIVAQSECMLNRQRREKPQVRKAIAAGERVCASASASTATPAPATIPASASRLPVSLSDQAQPRPAAQRPGGHRARQLRRLRHVRRGLARRGAVPVVLPRRGRQQPERLGPLRARRCGRR